MTMVPVIADPRVVADTVSAATGAAIDDVESLDVDVFRLRRDPGSDWVVRVVDDRVGRTPLETAAGVLTALADTKFPAERCAGRQPVLTVDTADTIAHLLVTDYVDPGPEPKPGFVLAWCAGLLARLATRTAENLPAGGGWHRLGTTPTAEVDAALALADESSSIPTELLDALAEADDGTGLPQALIHPDLVPANAIPQGGNPPVIIDWIGVGRGPRLWPLAFLLYSAGPAAAHLVLERYLRVVALTEAEWERLPALMQTRALTLDISSVAHGRLSAHDAVGRFRRGRGRTRRITAVAMDHRPR